MANEPCKVCGCRQHARVDQMDLYGRFSPGPIVRCVNCKVTWSSPLPPPASPSGSVVEAVKRALAPFAENANMVEAGYTMDLPDSLTPHVLVSLGELRAARNALAALSVTDGLVSRLVEAVAPLVRAIDEDASLPGCFFVDDPDAEQLVAKAKAALHSAKETNHAE